VLFDLLFDLIKINAGVVLGIILGVSLLPLQPSEDAISLIMFPGEILMRLLKQLIIPIILTSVITGRLGRRIGIVKIYKSNDWQSIP